MDQGKDARIAISMLKRNNCLKAIETFPGVKRRVEYLGSVLGVKVYDDYGHHPTEIKATIDALKKKHAEFKAKRKAGTHRKRKLTRAEELKKRTGR